MSEPYKSDSAYASCRICRDPMCDGHEETSLELTRSEMQRLERLTDETQELDDHQLYAKTFGVSLQNTDLCA